MPGLIAVILMIIAALLTSLTIAREWEMGTMEQLMSTPLRPAEIVLGKMLAFFVIGVVDTAISVVVGVLVFHVPLRGSILLLGVSSCVFLCGALFWGIFVSVIAKSQLLAYQMGLLSSFLPALMLSGFIYCDRQHAGVDSGNHVHRLCAVLCDHPQGNLPEGRRHFRAVGGDTVSGRLRDHRVHTCHAKAEGEVGMISDLPASKRSLDQKERSNRSRGHNPMWKRIRQILRKELLQTFREPRMRVMLFVPPLVQLIVFGYAVNLDVDDTRIGWVDQDRTPQSRDLLAAFQGSGRFRVVATPETEAEIQSLLDRGTVHAVLQVLPGFQRDLERRRPTAVQVLVDGSNSNTAQLVRSSASQILADYASKVMKDQQKITIMLRSPNSPARLSAPGIDTESRVWFNPDLRSRNYFVPGVLVNIIMIVTFMLTALAIVREKEIGTMEQLMVTPIRPIELMIGKTLPFAFVGIFQVLLITSAALLVFHIPFRGSFLLLLCCAVLFLMTTLGMGLFISTISQTQQQAMMSSFFFTVPAFMLSGFTFPIHNMPFLVQLITYVNPLRYFMEIVRGIFLRGTGVAVLWPQMLALAVLGVGILGLSALRFHKNLD